MHNNLKIQTLWLACKILLLKKPQLHSPEVHNFDFFLVIHVNITFWIGIECYNSSKGHYICVFLFYFSLHLFKFLCKIWNWQRVFVQCLEAMLVRGIVLKMQSNIRNVHSRFRHPVHSVAFILWQASATPHGKMLSKFCYLLMCSSQWLR